jgi:hypothetical protein
MRRLSRERPNASDGFDGDSILSWDILRFTGEAARCKFSASCDIMKMGNRTSIVTSGVPEHDGRV